MVLERVREMWAEIPQSSKAKEVPASQQQLLPLQDVPAQGVSHRGPEEPLISYRCPTPCPQNLLLQPAKTCTVFFLK